MRMGTKSCSECRRRKVRCTFSEGSAKCRQCTIHRVACRAQRSGEGTPPGGESAPVGDPATSETSSSLQARLNQMENLVRTLCQWIDKQPGSQGPHPALALGRGLGSLPAGVNNVSSPAFTDESSPATVVGESGSIDDAPLLRFLQDNLAAQPSQRAGPVSSRVPGVAINRLRHIIPDPECLLCILQSTQRFWSLWPLAAATSEEGRRLFPSTVSAARTFISESLRLPDPAVAAKGLVWLALCIQQLPRNFEETSARLPQTPSELVVTYLSEARDLVSSERVGNLDCIEALILMYKCFVNMGRPQSAWRCTRQALDMATLMGLHRERSTGHRRLLWTLIWQQDRHLSLFLGLPHAVPEVLIDDLEGSYIQEPYSRILYQINVICGHVIERDQSKQPPPYSVTMRLAEEMEALKQTIPPQLWALGEMDSATTLLGLSFWRRATIFFYFQTELYVHMPYFQKAATDKKCLYSRSAALEAAEGMLQTYQRMRTYEGVPIICDFLDFSTFSAAVILAVDLISSRKPGVSGIGERSPAEEQRIWTAVLQLARAMRETAQALDCLVATQSAEVLEHLHAARHGLYTGPEHYDVTIPYFGQIHISRPKARMQEAASERAASLGQLGAHSHSLQNSVVEFNSNAFNFRAPVEYPTAYELGEDWVFGLDMDLSYDWNAVFDFDAAAMP
ncbi:hypothetical protein BX600DRAFT_389419 [Xylariales sp. PMI_506]|nr:hypothetical protein BX600DRAFT_389419 [Xylariales sp. PMI_506]